MTIDRKAALRDFKERVVPMGVERYGESALSSLMIERIKSVGRVGWSLLINLLLLESPRRPLGVGRYVPKSFLIPIR